VTLGTPISDGIISVALLSIVNLTVRYGRLAAVRDINMKVGDGEAVCIVGPNGAGKSSTMLAISGSVPAWNGDVEFDGRSILGCDPEAICRMGLSMVPEGRGIFAALTIRENLLIGTFWRKDKRAVKSDIAEIIAQFPFMAERMQTPAGRLSGGEQQQLAIARALLCRPRLLLLDEPSLGLAPLMVAHVYAILTKLKSAGMTLLIVEQSLSRARSFADRICVMRDGVVQAEGSGCDEADALRLADAYFGFDENNGKKTTGE
jgi:branched-chain amino acid transport system ATP-binding protein